ncbi:hypothetical protein HDU76_007769 [Blyttiomyces sp. JEL0837]|nr:hypothetical protein HDU76_007769 [Blyttiomyces sp. JEL0837]
MISVGRLFMLEGESIGSIDSVADDGIVVIGGAVVVVIMIMIDRVFGFKERITTSNKPLTQDSLVGMDVMIDDGIDDNVVIGVIHYQCDFVFD